MNREILFRGFHLDLNGNDSIFINGNLERGTWAYGYLWSSHTIGYESPCGNIDEIAVEPSTIGQFTGLTDRNNIKIFEGDICKVGDLIYQVVFKYSQWKFDIISDEIYCDPYFNSHCGEHCEVIGNIYKNSAKR